MTFVLPYLSHIPRWETPNRATAEGELCRAFFSDPHMDRRRLTLLDWSRRSFVISFSLPATQLQGAIAVSVTHAHGTAQRASVYARAWVRGCVVAWMIRCYYSPGCACAVFSLLPPFMRGLLQSTSVLAVCAEGE